MSSFFYESPSWTEKPKKTLDKKRVLSFLAVKRSKMQWFKKGRTIMDDLADIFGDDAMYTLLGG